MEVRHILQPAADSLAKQKNPTKNLDIPGRKCLKLKWPDGSGPIKAQNSKINKTKINKTGSPCMHPVTGCMHGEPVRYLAAQID